MKVLIWTQYFWPENFHINAVARSLHEQGIEVTVLTGKPNYPEGKIFVGYKTTGIQYEQYSGFEVIRIPLRQRGKNSGKGIALNYLSFIASGYLFAPYALRGKKFDLIFVYAPSPLLQALPAIYIAWLKRAPLVTWVQDIWPDALVATKFVKSKLILGMVGIVVRYIYYFSDSILIQSEGFRDYVEKWTSRKARIRYFSNSSEDTFLNLSNIKDESCISSSIAMAFSVVFAGNIGKAQSCETIIQAASLLKSYKNIKFYLVGSGSMQECLSKNIINEGLDNVVMTGRVVPEEMGRIYNSASVLLMTLRDQSALSATIPSKLQNYLAAGKPVIACSNGESANVVMKANAGLSCIAGDAYALAEAVIKLYQMHPEDRLRMGENGKSYFKTHYQLNNRVAELITHFNELIAK